MDAPDGHPRRMRGQMGAALLAMGLAVGAWAVTSDGEDAPPGGGSSDTATIPAPDLVGLTSDEVQRAALITGVGLVEEAAPASGDDGIDPTDVVLYQVPAAGSPVRRVDDGVRVYYGTPSGG